MRRKLYFAVLLCLMPAALAHAEDLFDIKPMADGVYAAIAKPAYKVNCNAAIILLGDSVLVVDTHSKPSAARALIEQIKKLTDKPVRYVVNTHFHWDHYQGNQAYPSSWPAGVEIISSEATRENIEHRGIPRVKYEIATHAEGNRKAEIRSRQAPPTRNRKGSCKAISSRPKLTSPNCKAMQITLPTLTFDRASSFIARRVPSKFFGSAMPTPMATSGSICQKKKSSSAATPCTAGRPSWATAIPSIGFKPSTPPRNSISTQALGGHGDVMHGKEKFELWKAYFHDLLDETAKVYSNGASLEDAKTQVSKTLIAKYASKFDPNFRKA